MFTFYRALPLLTLGFVVVKSQCPKDADKSIQGCIRTSLPNFGLGPPQDKYPPSETMKAGITMVRESCRTSRLQEASKCMENILNKCKGMTDEEQNLQRLFDTKKIAKTVQYFCNNLDAYEKHMPCIKNQHAAAVNCSKPQIQSFQTKINLKSPMEVMIFATCTFHELTLNCLLEPVDENCGGQASVYLETIMLGQRPPVCKEIKPKYRLKNTGSYPNDGTAGGNGNVASGPKEASIILFVTSLTVLAFLNRQSV